MVSAAASQQKGCGFDSGPGTFLYPRKVLWFSGSLVVSGSLASSHSQLETVSANGL